MEMFKDSFLSDNGKCHDIELKYLSITTPCLL